jgi:putative Mg2+ transporter-C (MgtC) family protein
MSLHHRLHELAMDPARIAAGIVAGIAFIGAGTIWAEKDKVKGLTTAASLCATAAIGLTAGIGDYRLAITVMALVFIILSSKCLLKKIGIEHWNSSITGPFQGAACLGVEAW